MMKTDTVTHRFLVGESRKVAKHSLPGRLLRRLFGLVEAVSDRMRLVRAYNDLQRLDNRTLRDLGYRRSELDRVLSGHRPGVAKTRG